MSEKIAVIIPHFQRTPGILARTLAAMFEQDLAFPPSVIIVDDSSPTPAADELAGLDAAARRQVTVIRQPNAGPAGARNAGIAAVVNEFDYIALSDCDDVWPTWHLSDGMEAMRRGYDFFFGDHIREGDNTSQFTAFGIDPVAHHCLDPERQLYAWQGDLLDAVLRIPLIGLSTAMWRTARLGGLRFNPGVGLADDLYFGLEVAGANARYAFSARHQALYGKGDNISVVTDWRSNKALFSIVSLARYHAKVITNIPLDDVQYRFVKDRLHRTRRDFVVTLLAMIKSRAPIDLPLVRAFVAEQPATLLKLPSAATSALLRLVSPRTSRN